MGESAYLTYYQRDRDVVLNRTKDYYENDQKRFREQAGDKYRNLSKNKKITKENIENLNIDILICLQKRKKD